MGKTLKQQIFLKVKRLAINNGVSELAVIREVHKAYFETILSNKIAATLDKECYLYRKGDIRLLSKYLSEKYDYDVNLFDNIMTASKEIKLSEMFTSRNKNTAVAGRKKKSGCS